MWRPQCRRPAARNQHGRRRTHRGRGPQRRKQCDRRQPQHHVHDGEHPVWRSQPYDMHHRADERRRPYHRQVRPSDRRAEREQHRRIGAGDDQEDVGVVDAAQHARHLGAAPRYDVQQGAVAEQQYRRRAVNRACGLDRSGRRDADQHDGCGDAQRQGDEVLPSAQSRLAVAECIDRRDLAFGGFQCGLGLAIACARGAILLEGAVHRGGRGTGLRRGHAGSGCGLRCGGRPHPAARGLSPRCFSLRRGLAYGWCTD